MAEDNKNSVDTSDIVRLWDKSKSEIFRLQLLNTYRVKEEEEDFNKYMSGKVIDLDGNPDTKAWMDSLRKKREENVRNVNLVVVDLPLSDYVRFAIDVHYSKQVHAGREVLFLNRKDADGLLSGHKDYWEFDSEVVMLMNYDSEGHFLSGGPVITDKAIVGRYTSLKNILLKRAVPMDDFLRLNGINIS